MSTIKTTQKRTRVCRVVKLKIIKPLDRDWKALGELLRDVRWRTWQLANEYLTECALAWHRRRNGDAEAKPPSIDQLNQRLGERLRNAGNDCPAGAVNGYITGGLNQKLQALTRGSHWKSFTRGERALPTMRLNMPIPLRGGDDRFEPLAWSDEHDGYIFKPRIGFGSVRGTKGNAWPVCLVGVPARDTGAQAWLHNLATNPEQSEDGWRQRSFEISEDDDHNWWLHIAYDRPAKAEPAPDNTITVGVKIAYNTPLTAYCTAGGYIGKRETAWIGERIKALRNTVDRRRRSIQMGGRGNNAVRAGRGRKRKLAPIEVLRGRIDDAQTTYNHTLSKMVVDFAKSKRAGIILLEDLTTLTDVTRGTFLGTNWRYYQLQQQIEYKAKDAGLTCQYVSPANTVNTCPECRTCDADYDKVKARGLFRCKNPKCRLHGVSREADYNAAVNIARLDLSIDR